MLSWAKFICQYRKFKINTPMKFMDIFFSGNSVIMNMMLASVSFYKFRPIKHKRKQNA